jgi:hypothetical protein
MTFEIKYLEAGSCTSYQIFIFIFSEKEARIKWRMKLKKIIKKLIKRALIFLF